jgi:hypothetical protein
MHAILNAEPLEFEGDAAKLPPAISTIVRRCLEKRPEQRFQSAADLAFALKSISTTESVSAHGMPAAPPIARKRDWLWLAAATAAMALIGAGYALSLLISKPSNQQYQRVTFRRRTIGLTDIDAALGTGAIAEKAGLDGRSIIGDAHDDGLVEAR